MASGIYKNGVAIIATYQAVASATGKTITMNVYDEAHALDAGQSGAMAEIGATGRYWKSFTPDAEGEWIITMVNTTDGGGETVKSYAVAGHDLDSVGDLVTTLDGKADTIDTVVDAIKAVTDVETGVKAAVNALENISTADVATELGTYDAPTKAELDTAELNIRGADSDTLETLSDQLDAVSSPAMVG